VEPQLRHVGRNLALSVSSAFAVQLADSAVTQPLSRIIERLKLGIVKRHFLRRWDTLHGTLKLNVPQEEITIGVPAYRDRREIGLVHFL
jgi:hypothetical protein